MTSAASTFDQARLDVRGPRGETRWKLTPRSALALVANEVRKGLTSQLAHSTGFIVGVLVLSTAYLGMQFVTGQGHLQRDLLPPTMVAISAFFFLVDASLVIVADLIEEKRGGTFAQAHMTPAPPWLIMLGRLATASVLGVVVAVIATAVPMLVAHVTIPLRLAALVPYALALVNVLAFSFLLGAIALTSPMVGVLHQMTTTLVIMLNGSILPLAFYPHWLAILARIVPTTLGVEATDKVLFHGASLASIWADGSLPWLIGYTAALGLAGAALFVRNHRMTMRDGRLGQY
jgi:ABC-2 type transport system permease protein